MFTVKITPNDNGAPTGKLADVELHFADPACPSCQGDRTPTAEVGGPLDCPIETCATCNGHGVLVGANPLAGLRLLGFSIWERRAGSGRTVTFPARTYSVNGERRSFALLRPIVDAIAQDRIREQILHGFAEFARQTAEVA